MCFSVWAVSLLPNPPDNKVTVEVPTCILGGGSPFISIYTIVAAMTCDERISGLCQLKSETRPY